MRSFMIGEKNVDATLLSWKDWNKEYQFGQQPFKNWKNRRAPLGFNYTAELIRDTTLKLKSDSARWAVARFVPGYRILAMWGCGTAANFCQWQHIEMIFHNGLLINFTADADPMVYKVMTAKNGQPRIVTKKDTIAKYVPTMGKIAHFAMDTTWYVWRSGNNKAELTVADYLDSKFMKRKSTVLVISDSVSTAAYEQQVRQQMAELKRKAIAQK
ncbi:hypothetical protein DN068_03425 [Taibaiella soli]|uniref:Uncharacterized protein n=2 Tax=Taibaiella soli TaxID=1649169 RepID=A0A2W2AH88_9BACT|nr:hypothetical protein DN068_03425 [Taibaiella soli]